MFPKFLGFIFVVAIGYLLFQSYGYRYVLDHVRTQANVEMVIGRPNAPINILVYMDYTSEASKQLDTKLVSLLSSDPDVNVLIRPVATSQNNSELLTRLAFAAQKEGKFMDMHNITMQYHTDFNEDRIATSFQAMGINYPRLKASALSEETNKEIDSINSELLLLGIDSIPTYYIEHVKMEGASDSVQSIMSVIDRLKSGRL
jgi:protein-disulfide isomerase